MSRSKSLVPVFAASLVLAPTALAQASSGTAAPSAVPYIEAVATGEVRLAPDRATVTVGVEARAPSASAAAAANARIQRAVIDTLRKIGFTESMTTTSDFDVSPDRSESTGRRIAGRYVATNSVQVRLTELARIGEVIDAALARGATTVSDVEFSASAPDSAQQAAVASAVLQARRQAAALAAALGGSLGALLQATTNPSDGGRVVLGYSGTAFKLRAQARTSIAPSELTIQASVQARWQFLGR